MKATELFDQARDTMTVQRVFGEAYERNGVTVIPVAVVRGGAGGGEGEGNLTEATGKGSGAGGGYCVSIKPVGVYAIEGATVRWEPAVDRTRMIIGGQIVAIVALIVLRSIIRR